VVGFCNHFVTTNDAPHVTNVEYRGAESNIAFEATEASVKTLVGISPIKLSRMIGHVSSTPAATSITIDARQNESSPGGTPTITWTTGGSKEANDLTHTLALASGDYFSVRSVPAASFNGPALTNLAFGMGEAPALARASQIVMVVFTDRFADADIPGIADPCCGFDL